MAKVRLNENEEIVKMVKEDLRKRAVTALYAGDQQDTRVYVSRIPDQIADPDFEGYCHCMLYYKER